jgi:hypothetical protein
MSRMNVKSLLCIGVILASGLPVHAQDAPAEELTNLKHATPEEIASCGRKLGIAKALKDTMSEVGALVGMLATIAASRGTYQTLSWLPGPVRFGFALFNGLIAFPAVTLTPYFLEKYLDEHCDNTFDEESLKHIEKYAHKVSQKAYPYAFMGLVLTGLAALSVSSMK